MRPILLQHFNCTGWPTFSLPTLVFAMAAILAPVSTHAEPPGDAYAWEFRAGPRIGVSLLNAEGYGREVEFDERQWRPGFVLGGEFSWRLVAHASEASLEFSVVPLVAYSTFGGVYDLYDEPIEGSFFAGELQTMVRIAVPPIAGIVQPIVGVGAFFSLPFPSEGPRPNFFQFFSPQVAAGFDLVTEMPRLRFEGTYQRSVLPFSSVDGFENGFEALQFSASLLF